MDKNSRVEEWPDPIAFLEDYKDFAIKARPLLIKIIADEFKRTKSHNEQELLHTLALEQMAFLIETLDAFFVAATHKGVIDIYRLLLYEDHSTSVQKIINKISKERILAIAKSIVPQNTDDKVLNEVRDVMEKHIEFMQKNARFHKYYVDICTKLKHKFLVMREKTETRVLLTRTQAEAFKSEFAECIKNHAAAEGDDLGALVQRAEFLKDTICFFIEILIRRLETQESSTQGGQV